jgi:RNA polymerase sigma factor (sigma-70 family)
MEWTSQAVRGSAGAFALVYERHHRALYGYCRSLLGDDEDARDALQSTMTKAFAALRAEERDFELRPWLFRIAHNEAVSRLRQRRDAVELGGAEAPAVDSPADAFELRERLAQLRADLEDLPERQRAALVLRELSGLGHAEIAAVLGGSPQTVKQTIFDARVALHQCAEGRGMACAEVQRMLSDGDGRVRRGRRMRAHMRACRSCREFEIALAERPARLAALVPAPPAAAAATWLSRLLAASGGSSAGGASWLAGTLATKAAVVAVAAATAAGAATAAHEVGRDAPPRRAAAVRTQPAAAPSRARAPRLRAAARPPAAVTRHRTPARRPRRHDAPAVRAPVAVAAAPPTAARPPAASHGRRTAIASHPAHPVTPQPAAKAHGVAEAPPPTRRAHAGRAKHAPPGQAKRAPAGAAPAPATPAAESNGHGPPDQPGRAHGSK